MCLTTKDCGKYTVKGRGEKDLLVLTFCFVQLRTEDLLKYNDYRKDFLRALAINLKCCYDMIPLGIRIYSKSINIFSLQMSEKHCLNKFIKSTIFLNLRLPILPGGWSV